MSTHREQGEKELSAQGLEGGYKRDFLRRLAKFKEDDATPAEKSLCDYFSREYRAAAFHTAATIAEEAGVSKATVIRFGPKLGFDSFSHMRDRLHQIVAYDLSTADRVGELRGDGSVAQRIIASEVENLRNLSRNMRAEDIHEAAGMLVGARTVTVIGFRTSAALAQHAAYHLKKLLGHVHLFTAADSSLFDHLALMREGGVVLAVGFSRYDRRFIETIVAARKLEYPIVAISEDYGSPLSRLATVDLVAPATFVSFVGAYAAPITLVSVLISRVADLMGDEALARIELLEKVGETHGTYY